MLSRADERLLIALRRRRTRDDEGLFLAEGVRVVEDLLAAGLSLHAAFLTSSMEDTPRGAELARRLRDAGPATTVTDAELARIAATEAPQGVVVAARMPRWELQAQRVGERATVLVLDAVQDPGNFGTMLRCADAFDAAFVAALPGTVDPWNPKAVRAAAGASFRRPVVQTDLAALRAWLAAERFTLFGADMHGEVVEAMEVPARCALVVGNEGAGLSDDTRAALDRLVSIPMRGRAESLNVAVAAGILLYLMTRT